MPTPSVIDLRNQVVITIDGLLELHETHGDNVTVLMTPEHLAYVQSQLKYVGWGIRTYVHGRQRTITFRISDTESRPRTTHCIGTRA